MSTVYPLRWSMLGLQIGFFAYVLSLMVPIDKYIYIQYLSIGIIFMTMYSSIIGALGDLIVSLFRRELYFYIYSLPLRRFEIVLALVLGYSALELTTYAPPLAALIMITSPGLIASLPLLILVMAAFAIIIGCLVASISFSIGKPWQIYIAFTLVSEVFTRFSTAYYPYNYIVDIYRPLVIINPLTHLINLAQSMAGIDRSLLLDPGLTTPILISYAVILPLIAFTLSERISEGGRLV
ncbi:MAG: ABC transporter permease [Fervidicoccaceae archaeon]